MYRYHAYMAGQLAHIAVLVTVSLTSIVWLTQALRLLDFIVHQGVSVSLFLWLTLLTIPSLLMFVLPVGVCAAILFYYHKLKTDSELVALQAAGLSAWNLARPALSVALGAVAAGYAISLYLLPVSYAQFREMQSFLRHNYVSILLQEGVFASPVEGLTVFIRARAEDGTLQGVLVHDNRKESAPVTMMADTARLVETSSGPRFLLSSGNRQERRDGRLSFLYFDRYALDIGLYAGNMHTRKPDAQEMFVPALLTAEGNTARETLRLRAEGHQRLLWPLYSLCLALLSLSLLLSAEFNRRSRWQRGG
jgi:lipopolysaccharide export system permease protein